MTEDNENDNYGDDDSDPEDHQPVIPLMLLEAVAPRAPLTKAYQLGADGQPEKVSGYGGKERPYKFRIVGEYYEPSLDFVCRLLKRAQTEPYWCVVAAGRADPQRDKNELIRRTVYRQSDGAQPDLVIGARSWLVADLDGPQLDVDPIDLQALARAARAILPKELQNAACAIQLSASHGFKPGVHAHLWFRLSRPVYHDDLSAWADAQEPVQGVDWSLLRPAQIHFVAAPVLLGGLADPCKERVALVPGDTPVAELVIPDRAIVAARVRAKHGPVQVDWSDVAARATQTSAYGRKALGDSERHLASAIKGSGERHSRLLGFGEAMGALVLGGEITLDDMLDAARRASRTCGYLDDYGEGEVERVVKDGLLRATPRSAPPREEPAPASSAAAAPASSTVTATDPDRRWRYRRELYGPKDRARDRNNQLLELARLPPWETQQGAAPVLTGHGIGYHLSSIIGHGLAPCEIVGVAASTAGAGKTALIAQLIDGLITRSAMIMRGAPAADWGNIMTPVLLISEMSEQQLTWRSGARWLSVNSQVFRGGKTYKSRLESDVDRALVDVAWDRFDNLTDPAHPFGEALGEWAIHLTAREALDAITQDTDLFAAHITAAIQELTTVLSQSRGGIGLPGIVQPVVVLDPIQRSQQGDLTDVEALNKLARVLRECAIREGWIIIITSDTNKATAIGQARRESTASEEAAAAFRGSYGLIHELTCAWYLRRPPTVRDLKTTIEGTVQYDVEIVLAKNRWGKMPLGTPDDPWPRFYWRPEFLQFIPMSADEAKASAWADKEANDKAKKSKHAAHEEEDEAPAEAVNGESGNSPPTSNNPIAARAAGDETA